MPVAKAVLLLLASGLVFAQALLPREDDSSFLKPGIVVEQVPLGSEAAKAGLHDGDLILKWGQGKFGGAVTSPLEIDLPLIEHPQEPITFEGLSKGKPKLWTLRSGLWRASTRPNLAGAALNAYLHAQKYSGARNWSLAEKWFAAIEKYFEDSRRPALCSWLAFQTAKAALDAQKPEESKEALDRALAVAEQAGSVHVANLWIKWGDLLVARRDLSGADKAYQAALKLSSRLDSERFLTVITRRRIGQVDLFRGELISARANSRQALDSLRELAPGSREFINALAQMGLVEQAQGNLAGAEHLYRQIYAALMGTHADDVLVAGDLALLGGIEVDRGNLKQAEKDYLKALTVDPNVNGPTCLIGLGLIARRRGDPRRAERYYRSALTTPERIRDLATTLGNVGDVHLDLGNFARAKEYYLQELTVAEKGSMDSPDVVEALNELGEVSQKQDKVKEAEGYYDRSLAIAERVIPGTTRYVHTLAGLADLMLRKSDLKAAASYYERALNALESQTAHFGGSFETRADFRSRHESLYREYIDLLLMQGKRDLAFEVLERSRARTLLETLAMAHIDIRKGANPKLVNRERTLSAEIRAKSEHRVSLLSEKHEDNTRTAEQVKEVEKQISELTSAYEDVEGQIRSSSPAYAALTQPQPLKAAEVQQQLLDKDTLLMEYSLGEERSHVFVVTPDSLQAFDLPKRADIERVARRAYRLIATRNRGVRGETPAQRKRRSRSNELSFSRAVAELSRMVLGPVASELQSKRLLIVPDGALAYIPFAVLPEPAITQDEGLAPNAPANPARNSAAETRQSVARIVDAANSTPLIVKHEIVNLPSASVLAVLRQQEMNRPPAPRAVAVLADPVFDKNDPRVGRRYPYPSSSPDQVSSPALAATRGASRIGIVDDPPSTPFSTDMLTRSAGDLGMTRNGVLALPRLRYSRQEADSILAVTPAGLSMEAVDFKANRAAATDSALSQYRIVHFATHGLLNSEHPELSGLVLSLVDEKGRPQDGFLELEDIYNLNLPADLVVLSACETGLGKEISGEGLVGLTRGFMYAGATRVMASLWKVSDAATAHLMAEFYKAMEQDGMRPAAALRAAQIEMLQQKRWSSPSFWAAFQIQGEWR